MNATPKKFISILASAFIAFMIFYGSYLPYRKSRDFIRSLQIRVTSLQDFFDTFSVPLDEISPVGQEEIVRNLGSSVLGIVQNSNGQPELMKAAIDYLNNYYTPIISSDRGLNFGQDLFILGSINEVAFNKTNDPTYLLKAKEYYLRGLEHGPKRPQFLYGAFSVYLQSGDIANALRIGNQIMAQWPTDARMAATLKAIVASSTPTRR
jgi:hypothetical protein